MYYYPEEEWSFRLRNCILSIPRVHGVEYATTTTLDKGWFTTAHFCHFDKLTVRYDLDWSEVFNLEAQYDGSMKSFLDIYMTRHAKTVELVFHKGDELKLPNDAPESLECTLSSYMLFGCNNKSEDDEDELIF